MFEGGARGFGHFIPLPLPSSDAWPRPHPGLSHLNNFLLKSSTLCEPAQYKRASARKSNFKKLPLWQIGLRYLDQRQALVAALPGAPHLSPFFRSPYHLERFVQCLTSRWASHAASTPKGHPCAGYRDGELASTGLRVSLQRCVCASFCMCGHLSLLRMSHFVCSVCD